MSAQGFHEDFHRDEVEGSSDRAFGLVFASVFTALGVLPLVRGGPARPWAFVVAAGFLVAALVVPRALRPLNRLWLKLGLVLHRVVNPVVMGVIFFLAILPAALVMKAIRRDALHRKFDPDVASYWITRPSPGTDPAAMRNQF